MSNEVQCIEFDGEFELIRRCHSNMDFNYPVVRVPEEGHSLYISLLARDLLPDALEKVYFVAFGDYIAILPDNKKVPGRSLFKFRNHCAVVTYPYHLRMKKIKPGYYKIYKFRDGIAFNRYETMDTYGRSLAA